VAQAVAVTYANAYGRASVLDNLCGFSFAATDAASNQVVELPPASEAVLFATANGIPPTPTGGVNVVNNRSPGVPLRDQVSLSPSTGLADQNLDGHLCLRTLAPGPLPGDPPLVAERRFQRQARGSIRQILADGKLGGIPTILIHGRSDALLAPNHTSRPYYALSRLRDGGESRIAYYEVTNAQHLDAFNPLPGYSERFIPLHHYFVQALDLMWAHLTAGAELPRSQVVRTVPRGGPAEDGMVPPLETANVPPIADEPARADRVTFDGRVLRVPE
jgi:hydroxybutyrate-dimer hydrolase